MRVVRETAVAITKQRDILGVHWIAFIAVAAVSFGIVQYLSFNVGVFVGVGLLAIIKAITKKDRRILKVLRVAWRFKPVYDPFRREPFTAVIVEDE